MSQHSPAKILFFVACLFSFHLYGQSITNEIDSLKQVIKTTKTDTDKVKLLLNLSAVVSCDDTLTKINYANEAIQLAENIKWEKGMSIANIAFGNIYYCIKNYTASINYYQKSIIFAKISGDKLSEAMALNNIANSFENLAQYNQALEYNKEALAINTSPENETGIFGHMGVVYTQIGDYAKALECYDSSLKILDELIRTAKKSHLNYSIQMAGLLITIGDIYFAMNQYDKALGNYNNALKLSEETKNKEVAIWALISIGNTYQHEKDKTPAIEYYNKALQDCKEVNDQKEEINIYNLLGDVYLEQGDVNKAMEYSQSALKLAEENTYDDLLPETYTMLGKIYTAQEKYTAAVNYLLKAVAICGKTCSLISEKDAWEALSNTYRQMNKPALALDAYRRFIAIRDSVYNISKANELTRMDLQTSYSRKQIADSLKQAGEYGLKMQKQKVFTYSGFAGLVVVLLLTFFIYRNYNQQKKANATISKAHEAVKKEKQVSENLLLNILPEEVARELKKQGNVQAKLFDHVTVLFTDFVNFTEAAERDTPQELVAELHTCFMAFDSIISKYNIEKIKTVGDAYIAVSGLPQPTQYHASEIIKAAIEIRDFMIARRKEFGDGTFEMRIGINTGNVVAGIVGVKKFAYDIWGDTVNIAARMEQYSEPGKINISQPTYELVKDEFVFTDRGEIDAKHKGKMRMYFVEAMKPLA